MTAKEMFEGLGYRYNYNRSSSFIICEVSEEDYFVFYKESKEIGVGGYSIGMNELQAINQQVKELGWLDE